MKSPRSPYKNISMAGVTLFHLARLRANKRFFSMLEPAQVLKQPHSSEEHIELSRFLASSRSMAFCFRLETRSLPSSSLPQKHFNIDRTGGLS